MSFVAATVGLLFFFEIYKRSFHHAAIVALSKYVIRCCLPSDLVYYYQIPPLPPSRGLHLSVIRGRVEQLCALGTSLEPSLDVRVGILFTYQKHLYGRIILLRDTDWAHRTSLTTPSCRVYMC